MPPAQTPTSTPPPPHPQPQSPFFNLLPPELRTLIYTHCAALYTTSVTSYSAFGGYSLPPLPAHHNNSSPPPALLLTCRLLRSEALPLFHSTAAFRFGHGGVLTTWTCGGVPRWDLARGLCVEVGGAGAQAAVGFLGRVFGRGARDKGGKGKGKEGEGDRGRGVTYVRVEWLTEWVPERADPCVFWRHVVGYLEVLPELEVLELRGRYGEEFVPFARGALGGRVRVVAR
ncbi:hypothetical protein F4810DRAFT_673685 [Camillea tinctor]|nr:hypothetical protein F4810DRAFT_673685 [Camillea tinctor]